MIPAEYYSLVYSIIIMLIDIPLCVKYARHPIERVNNGTIEPLSKSFLFTLLIILFVGFRPNSTVFNDGPGYWGAILDHRWEYGTLEDAYYQFATKWLMSFMSSNYFPPRIAFIVLTAVVYGGAYIAMRKLFPKDTLMAMVLFCGTFGVFSGATNGIKNGMACSMFLCALAYKDNWKLCVLFLLLSIGFHHSMQINIGALVVCLLYKNTKKYFSFWILSLLIAALHITFFQTLLANFTDEHGADYLIGGDSGVWVPRFRFDFVLYSFAPIALGWWIKTKTHIEDSRYIFYFNVYLVMNAIWLLCMYAEYTNRFAELSWNLFPLLILGPLLNEKISNNQYKILVWFVIGQLSFTLLQSIIYLKTFVLQ